MTEKEVKRAPFEENMIRSMAAIDSQIAREMQRTPAKLEAHGVQKWEPYQKRTELLVATVLNALGDQEITLDSVLVLAQAMSKALLLTVEDLGAEGLGKVRSDYCRSAMQNLAHDARRALDALQVDEQLN
jgi:hypothetical protein